MASKLSESKFASALTRPVLDLCHCSRGSGARASGGSDANLQAPDDMHSLNCSTTFAARVADSASSDCISSESHEEALRRLKLSLHERGTLRTRDTDADLLRFLKARGFDVLKARTMYEAMVEWRKEIGADTIVETFRFPERKATKDLYPHFHHKTDKQGRPIYVERYGQLHLEDLLKITTLERLFLYHIKEWEILCNWKFPACSKAVGRPISQSLTILDMKGVTMKHLSKQVRHFIQKIARIDQDYYPEHLGRMLIINAPTTFKAMWQLVKPWLDKNTQKKIEVHGSNYSAKLLELVDSSNLPHFLGGTCHCEGGCENSDAGPWNEYPYQLCYSDS